MLSIDHALYSGDIGPQMLYTTAGTFVSFKADQALEGQGWQLCWSESIPLPTGPQLQTLGLSRNFLGGSIQTPRAKGSLRTMILSSNYFSCEAKLQGQTNDHGTHLGEGQFTEPTIEALRRAGLEMSQTYPNIQPYGHLVRPF